MAIEVYNVTYLGDLYRIYIEDDEIIAAHFYALMGTHHDEVSEENLPRKVVEELETQMTS